jgi:aspartyl/asparaginyl-tRNA synthetase
MSPMDQHIRIYKSLRVASLRCIPLPKRAYKSATVGSSVRIKGVLSESRGKQNVELPATEVQVLGESPEEPNVSPT